MGSGARSVGHSLGVGCWGLLKNARLLKELGKPGMGLGWCVEGSHKGIPLLLIHLELAPVCQGFSSAGQGTVEYEIAHAALGGSGCPLQRLLGPRREA